LDIQAETEVEFEMASEVIQRVWRGHNCRLNLLLEEEMMWFEDEDEANDGFGANDESEKDREVAITPRPSLFRLDYVQPAQTEQGTVRVIVLVGPIDPFGRASMNSWLDQTKAFFHSGGRSRALDNSIVVVASYLDLNHEQQHQNHQPQVGGGHGQQSYEYTDQIVSQKLSDTLGPSFVRCAVADPFVSGDSIRLHVFLHDTMDERFEAITTTEPQQDLHYVVHPSNLDSTNMLAMSINSTSSSRSGSSSSNYSGISCKALGDILDPCDHERAIGILLRLVPKRRQGYSSPAAAAAAGGGSGNDSVMELSLLHMDLATASMSECALHLRNQLCVNARRHHSSSNGDRHKQHDGDSVLGRGQKSFPHRYTLAMGKLGNTHTLAQAPSRERGAGKRSMRPFSRTSSSSMVQTWRRAHNSSAGAGIAARHMHPQRTVMYLDDNCDSGAGGSSGTGGGGTGGDSGDGPLRECFELLPAMHGHGQCYCSAFTLDTAEAETAERGQRRRGYSVPSKMKRRATHAQQKKAKAGKSKSKSKSEGSAACVVS
jgi:hypothetical protein